MERGSITERSPSRERKRVLPGATAKRNKREGADTAISTTRER